MEIYLHNSLTNQKELFTPIKRGTVSIYDCGPTVYDRIHIGNFRAYIFPDLLRRTFEYNGYKVTQIINITDVGHLVGDGDVGDDKMTRALKREGKPLTLEAMHEVATKYLEQFKEDMNKLNIKEPEKLPRASDHIPDNIELIKQLESKGFAYVTSDGVYYDTAKFNGYGKLGNIDLEGQKEGVRVSQNSEKKNPSDFALWKFDDKKGWPSPWGQGFPGWHIECSSMSAKYLGQPFDIHTGGKDLAPTHHNNEIAQSEAAYDKPLANYWLHNEFLNVDSGKMSKSTGNYLTVGTLEDEAISPLSYRYWLLTAHYRSPIKFSFEAVRSAQNALIRLMKTVSTYPDGGSPIQEYVQKFQTFINDDLDTPKALALTWELIKDPSHSDENKKATVLDFDKVFGLKLDSIPSSTDEEIPEEIKALAEAREKARAHKDWKMADALRSEIEARGFKIKDTDEGIQIESID